jgi:hypothetical protein
MTNIHDMTKVKNEVWGTRYKGDGYMIGRSNHPCKKKKKGPKMKLEKKRRKKRKVRICHATRQ